jgi:hypothetical protein
MPEPQFAPHPRRVIPEYDLLADETHPAEERLGLVARAQSPHAVPLTYGRGAARGTSAFMRHHYETSRQHG